METSGLLDRLAHGDLEAIQTVLDRHGGPLLNFVHRMIGDRSAAEDLLPEVMVKLIQNAASIRDEKSLVSWLYTVGRNQAIGFLRHRRADRANRPNPPEEPERPDDVLDSRERREAVQSAIDKIDEPFRTAFVLCEVQGMDHEQASRIMGCSVKTVSTRLYRAWERFRLFIKPYLSGTPQ